MQHYETPAVKRLKQAADSVPSPKVTGESADVLVLVVDAMRELEQKLDRLYHIVEVELNKSSECCKILNAPDRVAKQAIMEQRIDILWITGKWLLAAVGAAVVAAVLYASGITPPKA